MCETGGELKDRAEHEAALAARFSGQLPRPSRLDNPRDIAFKEPSHLVEAVLSGRRTGTLSQRQRAAKFENSKMNGSS